MSLFVHEAEQAVIGAVLAFEDERDRVLERLLPHHFHEGVHQRIWAAILTERKKTAPFDMIAIHAALSSDEGYAQLGAAQYLGDMVDHANSWALDASVDLVLERAARRSILSLANDLAKVAQDTAQGSAEAILADFERDAADIAKDGIGRPPAVPVGLTALDMVEAAFRGEFVGTPVGINCLDHLTGGIKQDDVWVVGARTSMGKSVFGVVLGRAIAEQGRGLIMFSLEMPEREVQARLISDIAYDIRIPANGPEGGNVRYGDLLKGRGTPHLRERAKTAARKLASLPFVVVDRGGLTIADIRAQAQRQFRAWDKAGVPRGAVVIDHIGLVKSGRRFDSKAAETAEIVNELKDLAKYLKAPVIVLCQVNRATESRNDKRPTAADLNWSGAIEQIADLICLLYRESYYLAQSPNEEDQAEAIRRRFDLEMIIPKNRSGAACTLHAYVDVASNVIRDKDDPMRGRA